MLAVVGTILSHGTVASKITLKDFDRLQTESARLERTLLVKAKRDVYVFSSSIGSLAVTAVATVLLVTIFGVILLV